MNNFLFGFANSMYQSSKHNDCGSSNWSTAVDNGTITKSNVVNSHWENWKDDIDSMKNNFGVNSYRISIEWSHIEPTVGCFDESVLNKYEQIIDHCIKLDITPMLTLHHFTNPSWFDDVGGFEVQENIQYFVSYCEYVFQRLHSRVKIWCTINEPAIYAFMGYLLGKFPPHKMNLLTTLTVLQNLLISHVRVYLKLKEISIINRIRVKIGIVHNVLQFRQLYIVDPVAYILTKFLNTITDDLTIQFFRTGIFKYKSVVWGIDIDYTNHSATSSNDFIGLNFYANPVIGPNLTNYYGPTHYFNQEMGDMYLPLDPSGFSDAIDEVASLNIPIYITEMGIADRSDKLRQKFIVQYTDVITNKINKGYSILGCYFWTYRDNYEWNQPDDICFGFHDKHGIERESCKNLREYFKKLIKRVIIA